MTTADKVIKRFFGVIVQGQTYLNLLHDLLAFPLGLFYFIFLVTGLSVGIGTVIIWIGLAILALVMASWWLFVLFERQLATGLLRVKMGPVETPKTREAATTWKKLAAYLSNPVTWKGLLYLILKFPLGTAIFIVLTVAATATAYLLTAPLTYRFLHPEIWLVSDTFWRIDTLSDAMIAFVIGVPFLFISLHLVNGTAWVSGWLAKALLGNPQPQVSSTPASANPPAEETSRELDARQAGEQADSIPPKTEGRAPAP